MSETYHLRCWTRALVPASEVWAARAAPDALRQELPGWIQIGGDAHPGAPNPGDTTERRLALPMGLSAVDWSERYETWEPPSRWVKIVEPNDLFSEWHHEQLVEETTDGCRAVDVVTFTPNGPHKLIARAVLELFIMRHRSLAARVATDKRATAVAVMRLQDLDW